MHYYIDGYNMLFRLTHADDDLQSSREYIIYELDKKISLINLNVSLVFDAAFQLGGRSRSHFHALEILFTAEGETADEFILEEIRNSSTPHQKTVVTSDKKLAWWARRWTAHTESVEDFLSWLNRSYKNKLKQFKKGKKSPLASPNPASPLIAQPKPTESIIPSGKAPVEEYSNYYEQVFETKFQELVQTEDMRIIKKNLAHPPSKKKMKKKPIIDRSIQKSVPDMERWLKTFEERFRHPDQDSNDL